MVHDDAISVIKENECMMNLKAYQKYILARMYGPEDYEKIVDGMRRMNLIKEDKDMPNEGTTTLKGCFEWREKRQADYYAEVWEFMKETDDMSAEDFCECFGSGREVYDIFSNFEEAKRALEKYKENKQIRPGDYVKAVYPYNSYTNYDILVIDTIENISAGVRKSYKCIARKRGVDSSLISKNTYISLNLLDGQIEKTGKRCKNFNYAMYTLFEDC